MKFMRDSIRAILLFAIILLTTGCNGDIFTDDSSPSAKELNVTVGEEQSFDFQTDGLTSIDISFINQQFTCSIYDRDGNRVNTYDHMSHVFIYDKSSTLPYISRMTAGDDNSLLEIVRDPEGRMTLRVIKNDSWHPICGNIILKYSYKQESIAFVIESDAGSATYRITEIIRSEDCGLAYRSTHEDCTTYSNHSSQTIMMPFCPAERCITIVTVHTDGLSDLNIDPATPVEKTMIEIPTVRYAEGEDKPHVGYYGLKTSLQSAQSIESPDDSALPPGKSFFTEFNEEVPPMTAKSVSLSVKAVDIYTTATIVLTDSNTGKEKRQTTNIRVVQAYDYDIKWTQKLL